MSKGRKKDKKSATGAATATPRVAKPKIRIEETRTATAPVGDRALTFGPETYKWIGIGFGLVLLGLILMAGGRGDNFTEFDTSDIYSPVKLTVAPLVILGGLGTVIYAILKK